MEKFIYMDNAATTKISDNVFNKMLPFLKEEYGNASSIYKLGNKSKVAINQARERIAKAIESEAREIYFTSGGTEADNWAIKGVAYGNSGKGKHIITSKIEHHAVLHPCEYLERQGFEVTYLDVDEYGFVDLQQLEKEIREDTILISIMFANNEIGTIQPIKEIGQIAKKNKILFHTDAVQAIGSVKIDVKDLNIDLMTLSSHKIKGPKGVGALYIRQGVKIDPLIIGGGQERTRRGGTENVASIVGFGYAIEDIYKNMEERNTKLVELRDYMIKEILEKIPYAKLNGDKNKRLPNNINISFLYIEGEGMLLLLDSKGIAASSGSACTSGSLDPSHVLLATGLKHEEAHGSLRLTINDEISREDADYVVENLTNIVNRLREMSPLYEKIKEENQ